MMQSKIHYWYQPSLNTFTMLLLPFSWLFAAIAAIRRWCYRKNILKSHRFNIPVIVIGNLTVGGTGKTPCVVALADFLRRQGYHPGIVSRGVGGKKHRLPVLVKADSLVSEVGDEALLLARTTNCPLVVCSDRVAAVQRLQSDFSECDIVLSDDGLQHYRMARDIEIIVVDGYRLFGNGYLLPAGPLREPLSRLNDADFTIVNSGSAGSMKNAYTMTMKPTRWVSLKNSELYKDVNAWQSQPAHAVAGIGNPKRFFELVRQLGCEISEHAFPDHYAFAKADLAFGDDKPVLMTHKDAVKCEQFADGHCWYLDVSAKLSDKFLHNVIGKLQQG